ncbi:MAG: ubiquinol-cytochrome C reductase, iron-sulfur subunit [Pseudomonadota bacterium]
MQGSGEPVTRIRIRALLKLMALAGMLVLGFVLLGYTLSVFRGAEEQKVVDLTPIAPGEMRRLNWSGRHVLVVHRDAALLGALGPDQRLVDPEGRRGWQPDGLQQPLRSLRPPWLVVIGESTDLGCELDLIRPDVAEGWSGGFVDRCRGGRYDAAGRVFAGQEARRNLAIPPHRFIGDRLILGGE